MPAETLDGRHVTVLIEPLDIDIPSEVFGERRNGKPRLRKVESNNRQKLHLPQLVMAAARLPEPARQDVHGPVVFPLEDGRFVMNEMVFDIIEDDGSVAVLAPLRISILHSDAVIDLQDRFKAIANDLANIQAINERDPDLASQIAAHGSSVKAGVNSAAIASASRGVIQRQRTVFGKTNAGSALELVKFEALPETENEAEIIGKEGRLLMRIHTYRERDRKLSTKARKHFKDQNGKLVCAVCEIVPVDKYGSPGERCIEVHHCVPVHTLQPDSVMGLKDLAPVCASCHRVIHFKVPCLTIDEARALISPKRLPEANP